MNVWTYLGNNWQGIWRVIVGCAGLELLIEPKARNRLPVSGYRTGKIRKGSVGAENNRVGKAGARGSGNANVRAGSSRLGTARAGCVRNGGTAGNYRRMIFFLLMTIAVIAIKLRKFQFYVDMPLTVAVFAIYLVFLETQMTAFPPLDAVYIGCVMFLCMDFCVAAANTVYYRTALETTLAGKALVELIFSAVLLVLCVLMRRFVLTDRESRMKGRDFCLLILALTPYLFIRCNSSLYGLDGQVGLALGVTLLLAMAASFGTLVGNRNAILAQQEHTRRLEMEAELREREKQFEIRRETIDEVNRRYHDMIKYARLYDLGKDPSGLIHYLEERMTENASMGSLIKTGNSMLDMILWEKTEVCERENLRLIPNVDARGLDFLEDFDLHTMVGNALDNAVEAARQVRDIEKREIHIRITRVNQMLFLVVSNFFEGERNWAGGQLRTTKEDANVHGYGLENITQAAERYDGTAVYDVNGDQFTLTVMLPLPVTS